MLLRLKYKLLALVTPMCWVRNDRTDAVFDRWLWDKLVAGDMRHEGCSARIGGVRVWVANAPYANGTTELDGRSLSCSRATALLLMRRSVDIYLAHLDGKPV